MKTTLPSSSELRAKYISLLIAQGEDPLLIGIAFKYWTYRDITKKQRNELVFRLVKQRGFLDTVKKIFIEKLVFITIVADKHWTNKKNP